MCNIELGEFVPIPTFSDASIVIAVASLALDMPVIPSLPILVNAMFYSSDAKCAAYASLTACV